MRNSFRNSGRATREQLEFIARSVSELSDYEMALLHLRFWNDYTVREMSSFCGLTEKLIQKILDGAIHRLRLNYLIEFSAPRNKTRPYVT